jgi:hypothetical protein
MKFEMFSRVVLKTDVPEHGLRRGDLATIVEHIRAGLDKSPATALKCSMR